MGKVMTAARRAALVTVVLAVAACSAVYRDHGYVPSETDLEAVVVGESTRDDVALAVGRPSSSGVLAGGAWYYVGSRFKHFGPRAPQEIDRQVVAISFDEEGLVENVERFGLADGRVVALSRRVTDTNIKGLGLIRQLLGSLGKLNAASVLGPRT
jgi:outer membrane protein assembly factor BamE (lipoprotein component of BamABCDE complex)